MKARKLLTANGLGEKITVIQNKLQQISLPEKVDVIVSEPLGVLLVHERMLETYVHARDKFLKPGGLMMPTTGVIHLSPFTDRALHDEQFVRADFWKTQNFYGMDMTSLYSDALSEHFSQPVVGVFEPAILLSQQTATWEVDFRTVTEKDLHHIRIPFRLPIARTELLHGMACWFDVSFLGSRMAVPLSTSPSAQPTHWQQCRLLLCEPIGVNAGQWISGVLEMWVNDHYSYDLKLTVDLEGTSVSSSQTYELQNQLYRYIPSSPQQQQQQLPDFGASEVVNGDYSGSA